MPQVVIPAIAMAASWGVPAALAEGGIIAWGGFAFAAIGMVSSLAVTLIGQALGVFKPKTPMAPGTYAVANTPNAPRAIIFGRVRVPGNMVFAGHSGTNNNTLNMVVVWSANECHGLDGYYVVDEWYDSHSRYWNNLNSWFHRGTNPQSYDATLAGQIGGWGTDKQGNGICYTYFQLYWNSSVWGGVPNISAIIRGEDQCYDPRTGTYGWTNNPALCIRRYLTADWGLRCADGEIDDTATIAAANICDEYVTVQALNFQGSTTTGGDLVTLANTTTVLPGGSTEYVQPNLHDCDQVQITAGTYPPGTAPSVNYYWVCKDPYSGFLASSLANARAGIFMNIAANATFTIERVAQLRYTLDGRFTLDQDRISILQSLLTSMAGDLIWQQGKYSLFAGAYQSPVASLNEDNLRGPLQVRTRQSRNQLFNTVRPSYIDPFKNWSMTTAQPISSTAYVNNDDGHVLQKDIQLAFTTDLTRAQRIATMALNRNRNQISVQAQCNWSALPLSVRDNIQLSVAELGWTNKEFLVLSWSIAQGGGIDLVLQEESSAAYDFTDVNDIGNTTPVSTYLKDPSAVGAPSNVQLFSGDGYIFVRQDGTVFTQILVVWEAPTDSFVLDGGEIELQYRKSGDTVWLPGGTVPGDQTSATILNVEDNAVYDVRLRAINVMGIQGGWVVFGSYTVQPKTGAPPDVDSLTVIRLADGTRRFDWVYSNLPPDVAAGGGFEIRYFSGTTTDWNSMSLLNTGLLVASPYETNQLAAGTYTFAIKARNSSNIYSADATFATSVILGDPPVAGVLLEQQEQLNGWPGTITNGFVDTSDKSLRSHIIGGFGGLPDSWSALGPSWDVMDEWTTTGNIVLGTSGHYDTINTIPSTADMQVGDGISGPGIPAGNTIASILNATSVTISAAASAAATGVALTISGNYNTLTYVSQVIDLGADLSFTPYVSTTGNGIASITMKSGSSADGAPTGSWVALGPLSQKRYVQIQIIVTDPTDPYLTSMTTLIDGASQTDQFVNVNSATENASWFSRIAAGHFILGSYSGKMALITTAQITALQQIGAGGWTWEVVSKTQTLNGLPAAEFKIYNASGVLSDALFDAILEGPKS